MAFFRRLAILLALLSALLVQTACLNAELVWTDLAQAGTGLSSSALALSVSSTSVLISGQASFQAKGGTAPYQYTLVSGGGRIDPATGSYIGGGKAGPARVRVTDASGTQAEVDFSLRDYATVSTAAGVLRPSGWLDAVGGQARFDQPKGMASDGASAFVADSANHVIRKIDLSTGQVSTLAGMGGQSGAADGTGTAASFNTPRAIAIDGSLTQLYVADTGNHCIRQIAISSAVVTTLAGLCGALGSTNGTLAAARFNAPSGITWSSPSVLLVSESVFHTVRKVDIGGNAVSIFAGQTGLSGMSEGTGTSVRFNTPLGLANDGTYLYVADAGNHRIRRLVISSATSSLLAGSTAGFGDGTGAGASFNQPQDVAVFGSYVYVADMSNHAVRRVDASTGSTLTVAGNGVQGAIDSSAPTSARFNSPAGIATVGSDVWVADTSNHAIRRFAGGAGAVSTPAGPLTVMPTSLFSDGVGAAVGMQGGGGVASDDRYLYFTDFSNHTLRKLDRNSGAVTTLAGLGGSSGVVDGTGNSARFNLPAAVTVDGDFLYVMHGHAIRRVDKVLGVVTTVAGSAISGTNDGTGVAARFSNPSQAVVVGGMLYMADQLNHSIRRVDLSSQVVDTFAGTSGLQGTTDNVVGNAARFNWPSGLATDGKFLYVADLLNYAVRKIDLSTQMVTTLVGAVGVSGTTDGIGPAARMSGPATLAMDAENRYLYCYDYATRVIRRIELATAEVTTVSGNLGPRAEIDSSWANSLYDGLTAGMAVTPDGLYIMSARGLRVAR